MRRARHLSPSAERYPSKYHVIDRIVNREHVLGREEKNMFLYFMRKYAAYHDVQVLSFAVLDNHFHLLVEIPPKKKGAPISISDEDFLERLKAFSSEIYYVDIKQVLQRFRKAGSDEAVEKIKAKHTCRMKDLSYFMQGLKRRFSQWFNKKHSRTGTLWEGRFKSVLVEDGYAARVMSAYIDLNPIRAGIVSKPENYRWCSYGTAMKPKNDDARVLARAGLCRVMQLHQETGGRVSPAQSDVLWEGGREEDSNEESGGVMRERVEGIAGSQWYRMMLFADGEEAFSSKPQSEVEKIVVRKGFKRKDVESVLAKGGKLSFGEALLCKIRYLTAGMVFGSRDFVDSIFKGSREHFSEKRTTGARPIREVAWKEESDRLYSMRALKKEVLK